MFPEKGGQNSIFFPSALKKGGQNRGAYQPTSLKGCPPPPGNHLKVTLLIAEQAYRKIVNRPVSNTVNNTVPLGNAELW